ncbi:SusC/RagA family TonB-linked outer membrane protein [Aestuariivivens insulae]|uniref:SusC/RagA family TonB-linked outer membrane protein n=1 Tax=Aestuariivivens insulae TaxID=1621988 RepID=UPI001F5A0733|nr:TonB-dependent receptor [Aestuariivivens insulae]
MKQKQLIFLFFLLMSFLGVAQSTVSGTVKDNGGTPLIGANIIEKGTANGVQTDFDGNFSITVSNENAILVISYIGFVGREIAVIGQSSLDIVLEEDIASLDEVVIVGYGSQKKTSLTASVSSVKGDDVARRPVTNISSALSGMAPGLISRQGSGEPGQDGTAVLIRGAGTTGNASPLVIVDGVPRSYNQLDPQSVESISILKDAAAVAPYGVAGANGVILITTKKGNTGKLQLSYNAFYGFQNPTVLPEMVSTLEYLNMRNAAAVNGGQAPVYSDEDIQKYVSGSDPDVYPSHDVYNELINKDVPMMSHNISMSGGSDKLRFYGGIGFLDQKGMWGSTRFKRYNLTSNVTGKVTNTTTFGINLSARIEQKDYPYTSAGSIFQQLFRTPPISPLTYTNGLYGSHIGRAVYGQIHNSGYNKTVSPIALTQISLEQKLPIEGLSIKGVFSYDYNDSSNGNNVGGTSYIWETPIPFYGVDTSTTPYTYPEIGTDGPAKPRYEIQNRQRQSFTYQGFLNYSNTFGKHDVGATFVLEARNTKLQYFSAERVNYNVNIPELNNGGPAAADKDNSGFSAESKQRGVVFRANYGFDGKYLFEVSGRYDSHYAFAPGKRWNLFPAFSAGWRMSEESFMQNIDWVDNLKIRGSYGESGALPTGDAFQYLSAFNLYGNSAVLNGAITQGLRESLEPNVNITWETAKKINVGFELSALKGLLRIEADYFSEKRDNMLVSPQVLVPSEYGIGIAQENAGKMKNKGVDFTIGSRHTFDNGLNVGLNIVYTYAKNKLIETFENDVTRENPNRSRTGRSLGTQFGYEAVRLFQLSDDTNGNGVIDTSEYPVAQFGTLRPGDIMYMDQNGDNKIDANDEVVIGRPTTPQVIYSFAPHASYKGFDLNLLFQGAAKQSFYLGGQATFPFNNGGSALKKTLDYWTPENPDAKYPRVLAVPSNNTTQTSSWWIRDGDYLRLKSAEIGYTLPNSILDEINIDTVRLYISGQNLLTWSKDWKDFDPETSNANGNSYPQQKVISFGINVTF